MDVLIIKSILLVIWQAVKNAAIISYGYVLRFCWLLLILALFLLIYWLMSKVNDVLWEIKYKKELFEEYKKIIADNINEAKKTYSVNESVSAQEFMATIAEQNEYAKNKNNFWFWQLKKSSNLPTNKY